MKTFTTPKKGTVLPLMSLKGKDYLQVAHRLVWFREDHPTARIETLVQDVNNRAVAKASISILTEKGDYTLVATAHKVESEASFSDYLEKAETGAIGRALAMIGYGTQFTLDLDEGTRIVDSPVSTKSESVAAAVQTPTPVSVETPTSSTNGSGVAAKSGSFKRISSQTAVDGF